MIELDSRKAFFNKTSVFEIWKLCVSCDCEVLLNDGGIKIVSKPRRKLNED